MSNILPLAIVNSFRVANNVVVNAYGIDATLYLANNLTSVESLDSYQTVQDYTYTVTPVKCWIEWSPNLYRLRKLGLFNEKDLPGLVHFQNTIEITRYSYIEVPITFLPADQKDFQQYEVVDQAIPNLADIDIRRIYKLAPRRVLV